MISISPRHLINGREHCCETLVRPHAGRSAVQAGAGRGFRLVVRHAGESGAGSCSCRRGRLIAEAHVDNIVQISALWSGSYPVHVFIPDGSAFHHIARHGPVDARVSSMQGRTVACYILVRTCTNPQHLSVHVRHTITAFQNASLFKDMALWVKHTCIVMCRDRTAPGEYPHQNTLQGCEYTLTRRKRQNRM